MDHRSLDDVLSEPDAGVALGDVAHPAAGPERIRAPGATAENVGEAAQALALGLGCFARLSFDDTHRLAARLQRR